MSENTDLTYCQKNRDMIINRAKDYYKNNKERLREQARNKHRNLREEEKTKKREYRKNRYHNMSEETKTKRISKKIIAFQKSLNISSVFCCYLRHTTNIIISFLIVIVIVILIDFLIDT